MQKLITISAVFVSVVLAVGSPTAPPVDSATKTNASGDLAEHAALFSHPLAVAVDPSGVLYVADTDNHTIRKISPAGVVTTLAGTPGAKGSVDGMGNAARFDSPSGIAVDPQGVLYVTDSNNHTIRKITPEGLVSTLAGEPGTAGSADGSAAGARFNRPYGIALDPTGNIYVTDIADHAVRKITPAGAVTTLAGKAGKPGKENGPASDARFSAPRGIAVDAAGNVYVCDGKNNTIRKITPAGVVSILAGTDAPVETKTIEGWHGEEVQVIKRNADGKGTAAGFHSPGGIALDGNGALVVADSGNAVIRRVTSDGTVTTLVGSDRAVLRGGGSAVPLAAEGVVMDKAGNYYVTRLNSIQKIDPAGIVTTVAGEPGRGSADGAGCVARFKEPIGLAVDDSGTVYVADAGNDVVRKISPDGLVQTVAGVAGSSGAVDGPANIARFAGPNGIAVDGHGNIYVSDSLKQTIRKITPEGMVSTFAGKADGFGSTDGPGNVARFNNPHGLAVDKTGNVIVADAGNSLVRKISPDGIVTTVAGSAGQEGMKDGKGSEARFVIPEGVAVDGEGKIYVVDGKGGALRVIAPDGMVTTLADTQAAPDKDGRHPRFRFGWPDGVTVDEAGNVYLTDLHYETVRKVGPDGTVTTVAGKPEEHGATNGKADEARFYTPEGIARDRQGNLYVGELRNHTIRKITPDGTVTTLAGKLGVEGYADGLAHAPALAK